MAKVSVEIGLTLALKNRVKGATDYEFIRPSIKIADIDTEGELTVKQQLKLAKDAIRPTWNLVDAAIEKLCEKTFNEE
jgi:hypothetical protein